MKLELKYLAPYLPYDLKGINYLKDISTLGIKDEVFTYTNFYENKTIEERFTYLSIDSFLNEKYKPILFPLSKYYSEKNGYGGYIAFKDFNNEVINKRISLKVYEDLLKNKFDVFELIDAGLAEPVTEDFNPYK